MIDKFNTTAIFCKDGFFNGKYIEFGVTEQTARMLEYNPQEIETVTMEISKDQSPADWNKIEYWGWYDNIQKKFTLVMPSYRLLFICFPYGIEYAEKEGQGKAYRLKIIK